MEIEETEIKDVSNCENSHSAVNSLILDYYKKFGKKRDLEQFFSLSTAQSEIRDPSSLFWRKMKSQDESSDSGGKKSESSTELCRISIKCSVPERPSFQGNQSTVKSDSESPPIISEDVITEPTRNSDDESVKSDDLHSQKSVDGILDTSTNKPHSPTSSINSQRKLEWDSLADVGYANESDRKNSASSLSTLERMALQQQYSNETKNSDLGQPTAQSTPFDANENKSRFKKSVIKKTTKIYNRDINSLELSVPPNFDVNPQAINLNLTKHISFNVDRNGSVVVENMSKNVSLSPEKVSVETEITPQIKVDKEIQTTLNIDKGESVSPTKRTTSASQVKRYPVLINLNTLKKKTRKNKVRRNHKFQSKQRIMSDKENLPFDKCGDQLSEAESFEYMPGHIYNENCMKNNQQKKNVSRNKSSLESSGTTTDSSNKKFSFTKDLERSIDILKSTLDGKYEHANLRKELIKEIVQKIVDSKYSGDKSSTEFLSGLSFDSKKIDLRDPAYSTSTSTSDANTSAKQAIISKPKKSILRMEKFNTTSALASTSQSVPNIPIFTKAETCDSANILKLKDISNTDSDYSIKTKNLSDTAVNKTSSEELYKKYLEALKREQAHKKKLKDKEIFLKQKLDNSDYNFNVAGQVDSETQNRIKHLMKDLVRNNYDDGSGDASKLEGGSSANLNIERYNSIRKQQSHSVFTLSSGNSENNNKNEIAHKHKNEASDSKINKSVKHYCCCPYHTLHPKIGVTDSAVQVTLECPKNINTYNCKINSRLHQHANTSDMQPLMSESLTKNQEIISGSTADNNKYVCLCTEEGVVTEEMPENFLIYKCSRLPTKCIKLGGRVSKVTNTPSVCSSKSSFKSQDCEKKCLVIKDSNSSNNLTSKSSQTNIILPIILKDQRSQQNLPSLSEIKMHSEKVKIQSQNIKPNIYVHEATRCIQTEISIDPKKSDPSLSDINIVNDSNCVKLINEQYKKISQPILEAYKNTESNINSLEQRSNSLPENKRTETNCICASVEDRYTCTANNAKKIDKEIQFNHITYNISDKFDQSPNNFSIPIQGTNMTLKVTLGSGVNDVLHSDDRFASNIKNSATLTSKGTETVKYSGVENFTSLQEECSKEAQCSDTNILETLHRKVSSESPPIQSTTMNTFHSDNNQNEKTNFESKECNVNTCMTTDLKFNTHPTENQSHTQKPLLRSNTDPSKIEKASHVILNQQTLKEFDDQTVDTLIHQNKYNEIPKSEKAAFDSKPSSKSLQTNSKSNVISDPDKQSQSKTSSSESDSDPKLDPSKDPLLDVIRDITKRFSKRNIERSKRKKCFKEIITVLNYLLDTEESTDHDHNTASCSFTRNNKSEVSKSEKESADYIPTKTLVDKGIQLSMKKSKAQKTCAESSDLPISTDMPSTSSDSATCKVLNKIKRECEKYHQKRCKQHSGGKKCEVSSSTSVNCDQCRRVHHCTCRGHRCKNHRMKTTVGEIKKKSVAYNLIIQTSDSIVSEEINCGKNRRPLQNIIVKVPSKRNIEKLPFKEMSEKIERDMPHCSPRCDSRVHRSKSFPNESGISSTDEFLKKAQAYTVREYLEKNRPDFVEKCSDRQQCLKVINESRTRDRDTPRLNMIVVHPPTCNGACMETCSMYCGGVPINNCIACPYNCIQNEVIRIASERASKRQLLSSQLDRQQALNALSESDLKDLARELGKELRRKKVAPKFINEREMKKHSEKIYKSLPEVVSKKEELKKENLKKTNLLMANIFKKNLQKKTLHGTVNISNYSTVIKI